MGANSRAGLDARPKMNWWSSPLNKQQLITAAGLLVTALLPVPAQAERGDVLVRVRSIIVAPSERSGDILPAFPGEKVSVDNSFAPEIDVTYMASDHLGLELIAATTKHSATGKTGTTGGIGRLASTWVLPPTLTAQYHFVPAGKVRPYVGAGINYTLFYSEKPTRQLVAAVGPTKAKLGSSFGWAAQAGIDIDLTDRVFLNVDVKYIDIDTTARLTTTAAGVQRVRINLDPVVAGVGIGMRF